MYKLAAIIGISIFLTGCGTSKFINSPKIEHHPSLPRGVTWKPVDIKRETPERYVMDKKSRTNLRDNLADTERYISQQKSLLEFYRTKPNVDTK